MKIKIKKYFLSVLAIMLMFSNFSFATSYMLCGMKDNNSMCKCGHKSHEPVKELTFASKSSTCCNEGTLLLANSNLLSTVKEELPFDISLLAPAVSYFPSDLSLTTNINLRSIIIIDYPLQDDIPLFKSSLLI